jgi:hypothetical protein
MFQLIINVKSIVARAFTLGCFAAAVGLFFRGDFLLFMTSCAIGGLCWSISDWYTFWPFIFIPRMLVVPTDEKGADGNPDSTT